MTSPELTATITVGAAPERVWTVVTDVARMNEWSPQVVRSVVTGGPIHLGSRFFNLNRHGWARWPTSAKVVRFEPPRDFAFRVTENRAVWSFQLEPDGDNTVITHRREVPQGISGLSSVITKTMLGGADAFTTELLAGMNQTLDRIKAELEG